MNLESAPVHGFIPCFPPAAFTGWVVVEGNYESLTALICQYISSWGTVAPAQLTTASECIGPRKAVVAQGVDGDSTAMTLSALSRLPTVNQAVSLFPRHGRKED